MRKGYMQPMKDITEVDVIEFTEAVGKWPKGTWGAVVSDHGRSKLVEISDDEGQELDLIEVREDQMKLITAHRGRGAAADSQPGSPARS
jgi:hypothetical protein